MSQKQIYETLLDLKQDLGELKGGQKQIIAHQERQNGVLERHDKQLAEDRAAIKFLKWGGGVLLSLLTTGAVLWAALVA